MRTKAEQQLLAHSGAADLAIGVLEQEANLRGKLAGAQLRGGHAIDEDLARRRLQQTVYQAHRGGLARAVRAHERNEIAVGDTEAHITQDRQLAII